MKPVILSRGNLKTVSFGISLPVGSATEPTPGITTILVDHLERNTAKKSEDELAAIVDDNGLLIFSNVGRSRMSFGITAPPQKLSIAIKLFEEMFFEPNFQEATVKQIVQKEMGGIQQIRSTPESILSNYTKWETAFNDDPITRHPIGTVEGLGEITAEKVTSWHKALLEYKPVFAAVGVDISEGKFQESGLEQLLGRYGTRKNDSSLITKPTGSLKTKIDLPPMESANAYIGINLRGPSPSDGLYPFDLYTAIVDGGMSSRMFNEIREERNLSYAPRLSREKFPEGSLFTAMMDVRANKSGEALETTLNLLKSTMTTPIPADELKRSLKVSQQIAVFVSDFSRSYTNFVLGRLVLGQEYDLDKIKANLENISRTQWQEYVHSYWKPENLSFAVSGDAGNVEERWLEMVEKVL